MLAKLGDIRQVLVGVLGIEPSPLAPEASVLPLYYTP